MPINMKYVRYIEKRRKMWLMVPAPSVDDEEIEGTMSLQTTE